MQKLLPLVLSAGLLFTTASAKVIYTYDSVGNRICREIIFSKDTPAEKQRYSDMLASKEIEFSPNPTSGYLKIELTGYDTTTDHGEISIYSPAGQLLQSVHPDSPTTELNISSYATGIYILTVNLNDSITSWKLIKK